MKARNRICQKLKYPFDRFSLNTVGAFRSENKKTCQSFLWKMQVALIGTKNMSKK